MKHVHGVIAAIIILTATAAHAQSLNELTTTLSRRYTEWMDAFVRGDGKAMDTFETIDLVLVQANGTTFEKVQPRAETNKPRTGTRTTIVSDAKVRVAGDTAILTGLDSRRAPDGLSAEQRFTTVWRREAGVWKVWSAHWTRAPKP